METMTIKEVCAVLKITPAAARNRLSQHLPMPPSFKIGKRRLFLVSEFNNWILQQSGRSDEQSNKTERNIMS